MTSRTFEGIQLGPATFTANSPIAAAATWVELTVGECLERPAIGRRRSIQRENYLASGCYPIIDQGASDIAGWTNDEQAVIDDDLPLIVFGDHTRVLKFIDFPFALGADGTKLLKPTPTLLNPRFFYFLLRSLDVPNKGYNRHFKYLSDMVVRFPADKLVQASIADALIHVESSIDVRRRELPLERERKAALMHQLFTHGSRGEPTKQTEVGEIPGNWQVTTLGELSEVQSGGTPSRGRKEFYGGSIPWVKTLDLNEGLVCDIGECLTEEGLSDIRGRIRPVGTVMVAMYGGAGTVGKSGMLGLPAATNQAVCCIEPNPQVFDSYFLLNYLVHRRRTWMLYAIGTRKDPNISKGIVQSFKVPLPPLVEQKEISGVLQACDAVIQTFEKENDTFLQLFNSVQFEMMTGSIMPLYAPAGPVSALRKAPVQS